MGRSGTPRSSRPRGTPEQRAYYGARRTPSGTPRRGEPSPQLKAQLRKDIEKDPSKYKLGEYAYLFPEGYPYVVEGKPVSKSEFEAYQTALTQKKSIQEIQRVREDQRVQAYRPYERKLTPREQFRATVERARQKKERKKVITSDVTKQIREFEGKLTPKEEKTFIERVKRKPDETYIAWSRRTQQEIRDWRHRVIERGERKLQEFVSRKIIKDIEKPTPSEIFIASGLMAYPSVVSTVGKFEAKPYEALMEEWKGLKQLPTAFREQPALVTAGALGSLTAFALGGLATKTYKTYKQPKLKVEVLKRVIKEKAPIKKGVRYYREKTLLKVYEQKKGKWTFKEELPIESFYETYGIKEIGIEPIIKGKAGVKFYTKTGQTVRGVFPKDTLGVVETTALGKQPTVAIGGIIVKHKGRIVTGEYVGVAKKLRKAKTYGFGITEVAKERVIGAGISQRLIRIWKGKKLVELGVEAGIKKGKRVKAIVGGEYVFMPYIEKAVSPITFMKPSPEALTRISKRLKIFVPKEVITKVVKKIVQPKPKYPTGILGATGLVVGREGIEYLAKAKPSDLTTFIPEEVPVYKPREEVIPTPAITPAYTTIERAKQQIRQVSKTIQQEKEKLKQIPKKATALKEATREKLRYFERTLQAQRQFQKQLQKQRQMQRQLQKQRLVQQQIPTPAITPTAPFPFIAPKPKPSIRQILKKLRKQEKGFELFVKTKGAFKFIGTYPKAKAKKIGAKIVRETLSATFRLTPSEKLVKPSKEYFEPSPEIFRTYRIVKGKKVPLPLTFIQRRGKRLSAFGEVREIQRARKKSSGGALWWS